MGGNSVAFRFNPPTIPRKEQSNGYEKGSYGPVPLPGNKGVIQMYLYASDPKC